MRHLLIPLVFIWPVLAAASETPHATAEQRARFLGAQQFAGKPASVREAYDLMTHGDANFTERQWIAAYERGRANGDANADLLPLLFELQKMNRQLEELLSVMKARETAGR